MQSENIAIIDLGTNTFHLMVIAIEGRSHRVLDKYKEPVKLGEGGITQGIISPAAFKRGIAALQKFRKVIDTRNAVQVFAYATSAVRGASNAAAFQQEALTKAGIAVKVINGYEEAVLIYEGAKNGLQLPTDENVLFIDIGGGSVEFIVGDRRHPKLIRSLNIGAARLLELLQPSDPLTPEDLGKSETYIRDQLESLIVELRSFELHKVVGSSGTFETLGALVATAAGKRNTAELINAFAFSQASFEGVHSRLLNSTKAERLKMPGMDIARVDMIVMGSLLVKHVLTELQLETIWVSSFALKEGILFNYLNDRRKRGGHSSLEVNVREQSVMALAEKYKYDAMHAGLVSKLALSLYDQLVGLHHLGADERELLHYGAVLHDIGHFIDRSGHHKHGQYIVMNSRLPGFSSDELLLLGNLVRYHRKSMPNYEHMHFNLLYKEDKLKVMLLGGILRVAVNLDKAHRAVIEDVAVNILPRKLDITAFTKEDIDIEMAAAKEALPMLEVALERKITLKAHIQNTV